MGSSMVLTPLSSMVFSLYIVRIVPLRDIHKAMNSARDNIVLCIDGYVIDLSISTVSASGTIEIKTRIIVLSYCLQGQDNTAIAVPPNKL